MYAENSLDYPPIGEEPFNLFDSELEVCPICSCPWERCLCPPEDWSER